MNRIINWLLLIIIFVFDPLAIALVIAANFAFTKLRTHDALNELTKIQEEAGLYDNEGSDIYTKEDLSDWDSTLMDGLEDEEFEEFPLDVKLEDLSDNNEELKNINSNLNKRTQKINQKFNKSDDDLTIKY
jgi:chaperonin cofactor prefoldin